ncbi:MAG: 50S ribosomal protein L11 methyltransferase [Ignavibacteriae bacterium HGW-Ignavibacteriae-3]|nr:MAG: 50S ribosomal protein L11 methyltransferase [Ignavibacteriae bacterium HGW-Ignavibacteriae-3]
MKTYRQFKIFTNPLLTDEVSGLLWQLDIDGINETDSGLIVFAAQNKNVSRKEIENILNQLLNEKQISSFAIEEEILEDKNWNEEYEKNVRVIEVSDKIVIKPSFKEYSGKPGQMIIEIDPKMSFGTGEHATTKLVLRLIEKYVCGNERVLDVGSGTAVLGIGAVMLGADSAICIDNDEWCSLNGNENVNANGLEKKVEIRMAEISQVPEKDFELIVANINRHILLDIAGDIAARIKQTGTLILSGLLIVDEKDVVERYSEFGFGLIEKNEIDEWCALVFKLK